MNEERIDFTYLKAMDHAKSKGLEFVPIELGMEIPKIPKMLLFTRQLKFYDLYDAIEPTTDKFKIYHIEGALVAEVYNG